MAKDPIVQAGDPVLRLTAKPVPKKNFGTRALGALIAKMKRVLAEEEFGVAIAAPQVGVSLRVFVVAPKAFDEEEGSATERPLVFINPEIVRLSRKKHEMSEGCLSVRGKYGEVLRHEKATVRAQNERGNYFTYHGAGLLAHIFQHETDHLNGVLYIDKARQLRDEKKEEASVT